MAMSATEKPTNDTKSSTSALKRSVIGIAAGTLAGFSVAPFVTIIDKSIVQNASGAATMKASIRGSVKDLCTRPHRFIARYEFFLIFGLYSATYQSSNLVDTFYEEYGERYDLSKDICKFVGVSAVNMTLCIYKDRCFARHFGIIAPTAVPYRSLSLWAARDLMTILASFNAPIYGGRYLHKNYPDLFSTEMKAFTFCQLFSPIFIQIFSTPLHLCGLDIYNFRKSTVKGRMAFIRREYFKSLLARMGRIFPAFSIGGIGNRFYHDYITQYMNG